MGRFRSHNIAGPIYLFMISFAARLSAVLIEAFRGPRGCEWEVVARAQRSR